MTPTTNQAPQERQNRARATTPPRAFTVSFVTRPGAPRVTCSWLLDERGRWTKRGKIGGTVGAHGEVLR